MIFFDDPDIEEFLTSLNEQEAKVINMRFGLDDKPPMTLRAVGESIKKSPERVRQIQKIALSKMRRAWRKANDLPVYDRPRPVAVKTISRPREQSTTIRILGDLPFIASSVSNDPFQQAMAFYSARLKNKSLNKRIHIRNINGRLMFMRYFKGMKPCGIAYDTLGEALDARDSDTMTLNRDTVWYDKEEVA